MQLLLKVLSVLIQDSDYVPMEMGSRSRFSRSGHRNLANPKCLAEILCIFLMEVIRFGIRYFSQHRS